MRSPCRIVLFIGRRAHTTLPAALHPKSCTKCELAVMSRCAPPCGASSSAMKAATAVSTSSSASAAQPPAGASVHWLSTKAVSCRGQQYTCPSRMMSAQSRFSASAHTARTPSTKPLDSAKSSSSTEKPTSSLSLMSVSPRSMPATPQYRYARHAASDWSKRLFIWLIMNCTGTLLSKKSSLLCVCALSMVALPMAAAKHPTDSTSSGSRARDTSGNSVSRYSRSTRRGSNSPCLPCARAAAVVAPVDASASSLSVGDDDGGVDADADAGAGGADGADGAAPVVLSQRHSLPPRDGAGGAHAARVHAVLRPPAVRVVVDRGCADGWRAGRGRSCGCR
mmetsp:Transcript_15763/g.54750  ORF Transcript_15763/g.54750 Transcript_15763/m.54750 type:complete len:337 (+) Transcript_15763:1863-2873(+)